jgi:hypothetical protein
MADYIVDFNGQTQILCCFCKFYSFFVVLSDPIRVKYIQNRFKSRLLATFKD